MVNFVRWFAAPPGPAAATGKGFTLKADRVFFNLFGVARVVDNRRAPFDSIVHTEWLLLAAPCYFGESNFLALGTSCPVKQYQSYCKR